MTSPPRQFRIWLTGVYLGVLLMVVVGGITRLTGSGLSMVEWKPVSGWIPPLNHDDWLAVFNDYKSSPQYQKVNAWMSLADFQRIFFWEFVHRVLGRVVFFVAFVPWLYFRLSGQLTTTRARLEAASVWVLVALQGVLGWFMVKSGLINEPAVSHFRLAAHLCLAFFLAQWVLWLWLDARNKATDPGALNAFPNRVTLTKSRRYSLGFLGLLSLQIVYGAFMGGKRAGYMYDTFPDVGGEYLPSSTFFSGPLLEDLLHSAAAIHYVHRTLAWVVAGFGIALYFSLRKNAATTRAGSGLLGLLALQITLGALTVIFHVPLVFAVAHQLVAALLLSAAVWLHHDLKAVRS